MSEALTRGIGLTAATAYAVFVGWLFATQPRTLAEVRGGLAASVGAYRIDTAAFDEALGYFRAEQFPNARAAFARADPAARDARTQFYVAYSYYRQGWHRTHRDDELYRSGLVVMNHALTLAPPGQLVVDDPDLAMHRGEELKQELEAGLKQELSDFDPRRLLERRK
jgi:hypothetical protein